MEIEQYAPVIIPTLNRYEHFKCCIESLERCSGADKTDVYVGLDFPPSDKYIEGWKNIDAYLAEKEKNNGFNNLFVRRRDHNCGVGTPTSNSSQLSKEIRAVSDRYILTEDDNEFSPNFLEYVNWALKEFEEDESIYAICGFTRIDTSGLRNNVYKYPRYNAWGMGLWFRKKDKLNKVRNLSYLHKYLDDMPLSSVFSSDVIMGGSIINMLKERRLYGDLLPSLLPKNEQYCLFPTISMVRNHGHDGLGIHGGSANQRIMYENLPIDTSERFIPNIVEDLYQPILDDKYRATYHISKRNRIRCMLKFLLYKTTRLVIVRENKDPWYKITLKKVR